DDELHRGGARGAAGVGAARGRRLQRAARGAAAGRAAEPARRRAGRGVRRPSPPAVPPAALPVAAGGDRRGACGRRGRRRPVRRGPVGAGGGTRRDHRGGARDGARAGRRRHRRPRAGLQRGHRGRGEHSRLLTASRRLVLVIWITLAVAYGLFFSFSIFFVPLIQEFRWSRALTAGAMSVSSIVQGVCAPLAGVLADRFGPRAMILAGVVMLASASMLAATIQAPWQLYLFTGVLGALGLVFIGWVPMGLLISR